MSTSRIWAVSYLVLVFALVSLAVYTRGVDQAWRECIPPVVKQNTEASQAAREAANRKDRSELERLEAMRHIVQLRIPGNRPPTDAETLAYAAAYDQASREYEAELRRVLRVRAENPLPDFEDLCHAND